MPELLTESVILSRHLDVTDRKQLLKRYSNGELVRLHRGAYVESSIWELLDADARHRAKALAVALHFDESFVLSHLTAAAMWRLPRIGNWPDVPHIAGAIGSSGRTAAFMRHGRGTPVDVDTIDGLRVTSLCATVVDASATVTFGHAVVLADAALRRTKHPVRGLPRTTVTREDMIRELARIPATHGGRRAHRAIEFSDGRADRPGESLSRVSMKLGGVRAPQLQVSMLGASGRSYDVDFWWEEFNVIGEFDGRYKYTDPQYMNGRTPQQVLYDEKLREDDLRAASHGFTRWPWATAISPTLLRSHLARAGVH